MTIAITYPHPTRRSTRSAAIARCHRNTTAPTTIATAIATSAAARNPVNVTSPEPAAPIVAPGGRSRHPLRPVPWILHVRRASLRLPLLPLLAALGLGLLSACATEEEAFRADLPDDAYPLEAMLLSLDDLPIAMDNANTNTFDNPSWAQLFNEENLRGKITQLDARGRVTGAMREFSWSGSFALGGPAFITVQSTLYSDVEAAEDSLSLFCGALVDERGATDFTEFWVASIGDGAQGLLLGEQVEGLGRLVKTMVCFRTGRVVHAVAQNGLDGSQDIALSVRIAHRMYDQVRTVFAELDEFEPAEDAEPS